MTILLKLGILASACFACVITADGLGLDERLPEQPRELKVSYFN